MKVKINNYIKLVIALVLPQLAGLAGTFFVLPAISSWYLKLNKPSLTPPGWTFGIVWTILYILMGVASYLVWKKGLKLVEVRIALSIYLCQLFLNLFWSIIFFGQKNPEAAFIEIIPLCLLIVANFVAFFRISKLAAWMLAPYFLWVSFAVYLNYSVVVLNQ